MPGSGINLLSINEAFGEKADLYVDVLGIQPNATTDQIQQAYFNRRDELFHSLSRMDQRGEEEDSQKRFQLERQMDGVVMALRVLGDADARMKYDGIRDQRMGLSVLTNSALGSPEDDDVPLGTGTSVSTSAMGEGPRRRKLKSALKKAKSLDDRDRDNQTTRASLGELSVTIGNTRSIDFAQNEGEGRENDHEGPIDSLRQVRSLDDMSRSSKASRSSRKSTKSENAGIESAKRKTKKSVKIAHGTKSRTRKSKSKIDDDVSVGSGGTLGTTYSSYEKNRSIFETVKDEVMGALDDTSKSMEQVFNVFTLQDDEISAVFGRIDKAKRQMNKEFTG